ncbi:LamG-like jellyroll fold domain-containing protein [Pontibacter harenae]|uniref:LamG-like jellyroll fold domain-containing protein n=1 Tax=Pontibacter harenae TaxID=2894083 RepID=UPI001E425A88|nr:LamG-like jellyroll fold domain-containing protein [Pontibacter harenae]MCC9166761.1 T9SS type A sorting domain-containing protein [Pontibacter harenae]
MTKLYHTLHLLSEDEPCSNYHANNTGSTAVKPLCTCFLVLVMAMVFMSLTGTDAQARQSDADQLTDCPSGLTHYFGLDEDGNSATAYTDYVTGTEATCTTCPTPVAGLFAGAQLFDGTDEIDFATTANFNFPLAGSLSVEFWVKTDYKPNGNVVMVGRNATDSRMRWWVGMNQNGYAAFELWDQQNNGFTMTEDRGPKINDGKWHHIVAVREGGSNRNKLFVDGFAIADFEYFYKTDFSSVSPVNIGYLKLDDGYHFKGVLDEVMFYNRGLDNALVLSRYNSGAGNYCGPQTVKPLITTTPVTHAVAGQGYTYDVNATGKPLPVYSIVSGPQNLNIDASTGVITWMPGTAGSFNVVVRAANSEGQNEQAFTVDVKRSLGEQAGIVHHWMLNETSGTRYRDYYTPYFATATDVSKPTAISGAVSGGQRFDGQNHGLDVAESVNFNWGPEVNFSIEIWVRGTSTAADNQVFIGRDAKDSNVHWWLGTNAGGKAMFQLREMDYDGALIGGSGPLLTDGQWHQVVAVRDAETGMNKLFVDGAKVAEAQVAYQQGFSSVASVNIGYLNREHGYRFAGDLDEVKIFRRALTDAEIVNRFESTFNAITELTLFEGHFRNRMVNLVWETMNEVNLSNFGIERSVDGEFFEPIGDLQAIGNTNNKSSYNFSDKEPLQKMGYYRLKINKQDGLYTYSTIVTVENSALTTTSFTLYPNPVVNGEVAVEVADLAADEDATILLSDLSGKKMLEKQVRTNAEGVLTLRMPINGKLRPGIYNVTVITNAKSVSKKLVIL